MRLFVGNLPFSTTEQDLGELFAEFNATEIKLVLDRDTGKSRGFAFVDCQDTLGAIEALDGYQYGGRRLNVNAAKPKPSGDGAATAPRSARERGRGRS